MSNSVFISELMNQQTIQAGKCKKNINADDNVTPVKEISLNGIAKKGKESVKWRIDVLDKQNLRIMFMLCDCENNCHVKTFRFNVCDFDCAISSD